MSENIANKAGNVMLIDDDYSALPSTPSCSQTQRLQCNGFLSFYFNPREEIKSQLHSSGSDKMLKNWNPELTTLGSTRMYILRTLTDASAHSNTVFLLSSTFEFSSRMVNQQNQSLDTINNVELKSSFPDTHCSTIFSFRPSENYFSFIFDKSRLRALPFCGLLHSLANNSSSSF